jgi:hypothetical protein
MPVSISGTLYEDVMGKFQESIQLNPHVERVARNKSDSETTPRGLAITKGMSSSGPLYVNVIAQKLH